MLECSSFFHFPVECQAIPFARAGTCHEVWQTLFAYEDLYQDTAL